MTIFESDLAEASVAERDQLPEMPNNLPEPQVESGSAHEPSIPATATEPEPIPASDDQVAGRHADHLEAVTTGGTPERPFVHAMLPDYTASPVSQTSAAGAGPVKTVGVHQERQRTDIDDVTKRDFMAADAQLVRSKLIPQLYAEHRRRPPETQGQTVFTPIFGGMTAIQFPEVNKPDHVFAPDQTAHGLDPRSSPGPVSAAIGTSGLAQSAANPAVAGSPAQLLPFADDGDRTLSLSGIATSAAHNRESPRSEISILSGPAGLSLPTTVAMPLSGLLPSNWPIASVIQGTAPADYASQVLPVVDSTVPELQNPADTAVQSPRSPQPAQFPTQMAPMDVSSLPSPRIPEGAWPDRLISSTARNRIDSVPAANLLAGPVISSAPPQISVSTAPFLAASSLSAEGERTVVDESATVLSGQMALPPRVDGTSARSDIPRAVFQQLIDASIRAVERPVDLLLNPEELGRVRISMTMNEGAITMSVFAERTETLDLMRRHSDLLAQDLRQLGYGTISFSFGQHGQGHDPRADMQPLGQHADAVDTLGPSKPGQVPSRHETGLDIRV